MKSLRHLISEAKNENKTAVFTYGRMNPPTIGHLKLVKKMIGEARRHKADPWIFLSPTQNAKKDPLSPNRKIYYAEKSFGPNVNIDIQANIFTVLVELYNKGYKKLVMIVGSDRIPEFSKTIPKYNGVEGKPHGFYNFESIDFQSAGERDPDAEGVAGMSASKLRGFAVAGDYDNFKKGNNLNDRDSKSLYNEIRKALKVETMREERKDEPKIVTRTFKNDSLVITDYMLESLKNKSEKSGIPTKVLKEVHLRALKSWKKGHKAGVSSEQFAESRVNSFIAGGKSRTESNKDLWEKVNTSNRARKEEKDIDKSFEMWNSLNEVDSRVDTPMGTAIVKGKGPAEAEMAAKRKFIKPEDRKKVKAKVATPTEKRYLQDMPGDDEKQEETKPTFRRMMKNIKG